MQDLVGQQLGNYRILRLLGQGGSASVYLGEHVYLKSYAALKILRTQLAGQDAEQFLKEAQALSSLSHPHIVRVLDFAVQDDVPFLVMGYASGGTLRQRHPAGTVLPLDTIVLYVQQLASALQYAHDRRLIHRDIKPENMLLDSQDNLLLSDFDLALFTRSSATYSNHSLLQQVAGTSLYLAPEQLQGQSRAASDNTRLPLSFMNGCAVNLLFRVRCSKLPCSTSPRRPHHCGTGCLIFHLSSKTKYCGHWQKTRGSASPR